MAADADEHFLHVHHGLEPLVRPIVHDARRLSFGPGDAVYGVDGEGVLHKVHPAMGTEALGTVGPVGAIAGDRRRLVLVGEDGMLRFYDRSAQRAGKATHPFKGVVEAHVEGDRTVLVGDTEEGRRMVVWIGSRRTLTVKMPASADALPVGDDTVLYWASDVGLERLSLSDGGRFRGRDPAPFRVVATPGPIIGLGDDGVAVFREGEPELLEEQGVTCVASTPDGETVLLGTDIGEVLVVRRGDTGAPARLQAHNGPIHDLAVDRTGRMVASASHNFVIWGLDD